MLKEICTDKLSKLPAIADCDSKEAFLYRAIHNKALADAAYQFDTMIENIERGLNRA